MNCILKQMCRTVGVADVLSCYHRALVMQILWMKSPSLGREAVLFLSGGAMLSLSAASRYSLLSYLLHLQVNFNIYLKPNSNSVGTLNLDV